MRDRLVARAIVAALAAVLLAAPALARQSAKTRAAGAITGRVFDENGAPLAGAIVSVLPAGSSDETEVASDASGAFSVKSLAPGAYFVSAVDKDYNQLACDAGDGARVFRPGDVVTFRRRGTGVITGTVTWEDGSPAVGLLVRALPAGKPEVGIGTAEAERLTDDRGIYRLFGVAEGRYLVATGQTDLLTSRLRARAPYKDIAPVYHPSSGRESAEEVSVVAGQEARDVNIRLAVRTVFRVRGVIRGDVESLEVSAVRADTGACVARAYAREGERAPVFEIEGVPDGEYDLVARSFGAGPPSEGRVRVAVRGADVGGVVLEIVPRRESAIAGRVVADPPAADAECGAAPSPSDVLLYAGPARRPATAPDDDDVRRATRAPGATGAFSIPAASSGGYRIAAFPFEDSRYVRSMALPRSGERPEVDVGRVGVELDPGQNVTNVVVSLAAGAASVKGRVAAATEGGSVERDLVVVLVPTDPKLVDDPLRYGEAPVTADASFVLRNLAPGAYRLVVRRRDPVATAGAPGWQTAWDPAEREKLRREAEASTIRFELAPCQRVADVVVKW